MHGFTRLRLALAATFCLVFAAQLCASDFRIETKIFKVEAADEGPLSETITLFQEGIVYDFLAEPAQIAVFRKPGPDRIGRFILLDPKLEIKTELTTDHISQALGKLQSWAAQQPDPMLRFAAEPDFHESFTDDGKLILASYLQTYEIQTAKAGKPAAVNEYRQFLNWYTQLNAMHSGLPPQPRLEVNSALARHDALPVSVELKRAGVDEIIRAEHQFTWRLSQDDRSRIDEVRDALSRYRSVDNAEFLRLTRPPVEEQ